MTKTPEEALGDFLEVLRREFESDPELARRAVKALGVDVELKGSKAADVLNPLELIHARGADAARESLRTFSLAELKKIAKNNNLATPIDMKDKDEAGLIDVIVTRSANKIAERRH